MRMNMQSPVWLQRSVSMNQSHTEQRREQQMEYADVCIEPITLPGAR
jgi:hypothetical protein